MKVVFLSGVGTAAPRATIEKIPGNLGVFPAATPLGKNDREPSPDRQRSGSPLAKQRRRRSMSRTGSFGPIKVKQGRHESFGLVLTSNATVGETKWRRERRGPRIWDGKPVGSSKVAFFFCGNWVDIQAISRSGRRQGSSPDDGWFGPHGDVCAGPSIPGRLRAIDGYRLKGRHQGAANGSSSISRFEER